MRKKPLVRLEALAAFVALELVAMGPGCGGAVQTARMASPDSPATEGTVEVSEGKDGNTVARVTVDHLAAPTRQNPPANVYVVWIRPLAAGPTKAPQNMGVLKVDEELQGEHVFTTAFRDFQVFVTAEASGLVTSPIGPVVLSTQVHRK